MRSEVYSSWFVCLCVDVYSGTSGYERYQRLQNYANLKRNGSFS